MIVRIVKMVFVPEKVVDFIRLFEERKEQISGFPGCEHLELLQGNESGNIFFTYSLWQEEEALENYRGSDLFKDTWRRTKEMFEKDAEAWSLNKIF